MTRSRPFGVTVLAVLALLQAVITGYHTLQYLHILPFSLGPLSFYGFDLLGALLWGVTFAIWIWAARMLWAVDPRGWMFITLMAGWELILAFLSLFGGSTFQAILPGVVVSAAILIYCLMPGTRAHFGAAA